MEYITAGESHGPNLTAIVTGVPAGLPISEEHINSDLSRRQAGYGRGGRMAIERDTVRVTGGVRFGRTLGSPIALEVANRDWENWTDRMAAFGEAPRDLVREVTPRPGHADLVGALRTNTDDCRNILERASARETAARVAAAGVAREFLAALGVEVMSYVVSVGDAAMPEETMADAAEHKPLDIELSEMRCPDAKATIAMKKAIDRAKSDGESLGGTFRIVVCGLAPGLGTYATGADRLTSRLGAALFSIPAIKGVEFGLGFQAAARPGSLVHDPIVLADGEFRRASNNAGGLEGGMTTGMPLVDHGGHEAHPDAHDAAGNGEFGHALRRGGVEGALGRVRGAGGGRGGRGRGGLRAGQRLLGGFRRHLHGRHQGEHQGLQGAAAHHGALRWRSVWN